MARSGLDGIATSEGILAPRGTGRIRKTDGRCP